MSLLHIATLVSLASGNEQLIRDLRLISRSFKRVMDSNNEILHLTRMRKRYCYSVAAVLDEICNDFYSSRTPSADTTQYPLGEMDRSATEYALARVLSSCGPTVPSSIDGVQLNGNILRSVITQLPEAAMLNVISYNYVYSDRSICSLVSGEEGRRFKDNIIRNNWHPHKPFCRHRDSEWIGPMLYCLYCTSWVINASVPRYMSYKELDSCILNIDQVNYSTPEEYLSYVEHEWLARRLASLTKRQKYTILVTTLIDVLKLSPEVFTRIVTCPSVKLDIRFMRNSSVQYMSIEDTETVIDQLVTISKSHSLTVDRGEKALAKLKKYLQQVTHPLIKEIEKRTRKLDSCREWDRHRLERRLEADRARLELRTRQLDKIFDKWTTL